MREGSAGQREWQRMIIDAHGAVTPFELVVVARREEVERRHSARKRVLHDAFDMEHTGGALLEFQPEGQHVDRLPAFRGDRNRRVGDFAAGSQQQHLHASRALVASAHVGKEPVRARIGQGARQLTAHFHPAALEAHGGASRIARGTAA